MERIRLWKIKYYLLVFKEKNAVVCGFHAIQESCVKRTIKHLIKKHNLMGVSSDPMQANGNDVSVSSRVIWRRNLVPVASGQEGE
jgi:hypothetical protein